MESKKPEVLSPTTQSSDGAPPAVGPRVRAIRLKRRATLKTVADAAGISESFLSQIERGRSSPSVASLMRITEALGVSIADLFPQDGATRSAVLRPAERPAVDLGGIGARKFLLIPEQLENIEALFCELDIGGSSGDEVYTHGDSEEWMFVVSGVVEHQLGSSLHRLEEGDCITYRSSVPHLTRNIGDTVATLIYVISPPSF
jgi:transcriptional regulator with XRE-family HTH domain